MIVHQIAQRTPEWDALRIGRLTSSKAADMLATLKSGGEAAGRRNLRIGLALERITGSSTERKFVTAAMQDGIDREPEAVALYQAQTGEMVESVGFIAHDSLMAGCSPDGVIADTNGLIEVKCPEPAAHLSYLESSTVPGDYLAQIHHALWISGAAWCDFVSYQPHFPEGLRLKVIRVTPSAEILSAYGEKAVAFLAEVDQQVARITSLVGAA